MAEIFRTMIVQEAVVLDARAIAVDVLGPVGNNMFTSPLSPTGEVPITHYISSGYVEAALPTALLAAPFASQVIVTPRTAKAALRDAGLQVVPVDPE